MSTPIIRIVPQRHPADCGVAVLATYLGLSYEACLIAVGQKEPHVLEVGMWITEIVGAAKKLGVKLKRRRRYDLETDEGIVTISSPKWATDHVAVLKSGLLFDTDGSVYELDVYQSIHSAKFGILLTKAEDK